MFTVLGVISLILSENLVMQHYGKYYDMIKLIKITIKGNKMSIYN